MNTILCIGEMLIDWICQDKTNLVHAENFLKKAGGAPANAAIAAAKLGANAKVVCAVGSDPFGTFLIETLKKYNVNTDQVQQVNHPTSFAFVSVDQDAEREFVFQRGADAALKWKPSNEFKQQHTLYHFGAATSFLGKELEQSYTDSLTFAMTENKFISFDPNYRKDLWSNNQQEFVNKCLPFLKAAQVAKLSEEEALLLANESNLDSALKKLSEHTHAILAVTRGKNGTLLFQNNEQIIVPSIKINPVDTTGAGDAFIGAMLWQLSKLEYDQLFKLNLKQVVPLVETANKIAALSTTKYGALDALPTYSQIKKLGYAV